jgi:hypothetical protein
VVAHAQEHLRIWVSLHKLRVERAGRPVYGRLVPSKDAVPIHGLAPPRGLLLKVCVLWMLEDLMHMVAGAEVELLEGALQRRRAGPPEAGPYDLHPEFLS